jgi:molybdenum cofactor guanylyltransferase
MLSAILLAGGKSARMGRPKALLPFSGCPLIAHLVSRLQGLTEDVIVVTNDAEPYRFLQNVRFQADRFPGQGPLAGIQAGLQEARSARAWVIACDLPFVSPDVLRRMGEIAEEGQADALIPFDGEREYPVLAVYSRRILPLAVELLSQQKNRMRGFLTALEGREYTLHRIPAERFRGEDPMLFSFFNMNTPADYRQALEWWERTRWRKA